MQGNERLKTPRKGSKQEGKEGVTGREKGRQTCDPASLVILEEDFGAYSDTL